jgi:hypothetical protein
MEVSEVSTADGVMARLAEAKRDDPPRVVVNRSHTTWERFALGVREADMLLADFDGTLHVGNQWKDLVAQMPAELAEQDRAQADAFFRTGDPTVRQELALLFDSVQRMMLSGFTTRTVRRAVGGSWFPRSGVKEFVASFRGHALIVSFGIKQYIEEWCRFHGILPEPAIAALSLMFWGPPDNEPLIGYDCLSAVVGSNKGFVAEAFCASRRADPSRVIAIGDSPVDLSMMHTGNIGILLVPHADDDAVRKLYRHNGLARMWPNLSVVLISDSLEPLAELRRR